MLSGSGWVPLDGYSGLNQCFNSVYVTMKTGIKPRLA